jgi:hypothetical protein
MSPLNCTITVIGIDIGKNSFHLLANERGAIAQRQKWSRTSCYARPDHTLGQTEKNSADLGGGTFTCDLCFVRGD